MVLKPPFRGFMAPVFVPFKSNGDLNLEEIPKYAKYLISQNVKAILVNGTVGEGALMSLEERKKVAETWMEVTKSANMYVMVHVGGTNLNNVIQLAKHAESLAVSSILCLPDSFFKPTTVNEAVDYMKIVSNAAPKTPLFYYNYPALTSVNLDMVKFLEIGYTEIPTLAGLKYTHNNLDEAFQCVQLYNRTFAIFLGNDQLLSAALCMGFDSCILTALNVSANTVFEIQRHIEKGENEKARSCQQRITDLAYFVMRNMHWINGFKAAISMVSGVQLGQPRKPLTELTPQQTEKLRSELKNKNFIS